MPKMLREGETDDRGHFLVIVDFPRVRVVGRSVMIAMQGAIAVGRDEIRIE